MAAPVASRCGPPLSRPVLRGTSGMLSTADYWHAMFDHVNEMLPVQSAADALSVPVDGPRLPDCCWPGSRCAIAACCCAISRFAVSGGRPRLDHVRFAAYSKPRRDHCCRSPFRNWSITPSVVAARNVVRPRRAWQ